MHLTVLDKETELAETVLASSPRVLWIVAGALMAIVVAAVVWSYATTIDLVVTSPSRVRTATSPLTDFETASGDALTVPIAGQVAEVPVAEGDTVAAGALIMRLDTRRLDNDIERLSREIAAGAAELERGAALAADLAGQQDKAIARARAAIDEAEQALTGERERHALLERHRQAEEGLVAIELAKRRDDCARLEALLEKRYVSESEVATARFAVQSALNQIDKVAIPISDAEVMIAARRVATVRSDLDVLSRQFDYRRAELDIQNSRRAAEVDSLRRSLANLELDRSRCEIRAPFAGVVSTLRAQPGHVVQPGQPIAFVIDPGAYRVDALVSSADIGQIRPGMTARVKLDAFDYQRFGTLPATVTHVGADSTVGQGGAFYIVRLALDRPGFAEKAQAKLGMTGVAEITVDRERLLWLIFNRARRGAGL
ncbi:MAG TPA: HlyD family efflux transporter periplasmic adaptor subunit [Planctomycetota bacterium]|nr:HlyD family efflux transporter periplasmic adaptor subunit [Planctomycetota bacterium]